MRDQLNAIRPAIPLLINELEISDEERFQNKCLRPVLKFQNDLILQVFQQYIQTRKNVFYQLSNSKKLKYVEEAIQKDLKFRNLMLGIIIGQFTNVEYLDYLKKEKELRRRISQLLIQRIQSQLTFFD